MHSQNKCHYLEKMGIKIRKLECFIHKVCFFLAIPQYLFKLVSLVRLLSSPRVDASISEKQKSKYMRFSEVVGSDVCKREQGASGHGYTVLQSALKEL